MDEPRQFLTTTIISTDQRKNDCALQNPPLTKLTALPKEDMGSMLKLWDRSMIGLVITSRGRQCLNSLARHVRENQWPQGCGVTMFRAHKSVAILKKVQ
jgi:hypothetical protein